MKFIVQEVQCPTCGAGEMHEDGDKLNIRGFKVCTDDGYWWSQCLVCSGGYDKLNGTFTEANHDSEKGWF